MSGQVTVEIKQEQQMEEHQTQIPPRSKKNQPFPLFTVFIPQL